MKHVKWSMCICYFLAAEWLGSHELQIEVNQMQCFSEVRRNRRTNGQQE
uniref:Uncharacterized protein n=1 Tax=Anguilla anguilla TaxID=7936 RepID=A0A0E9WCT3_ANGAN